MSQPVKIDPGPRPELAYLPVDRLDVDPAYQRSLDSRASRKMIARIADNFRWSSFQAILVTPNGRDRWLLIDGQHRVEAAKLNAISLIPAVVIHEISPAEQAAAFPFRGRFVRRISANKDRVPVSAQALFHARLVAGDQDALTIKRLCDAAGITLIRHNLATRQFPPWKTAATPSLLIALRQHGERAAAEAINIVADLFGARIGGLRGIFFLSAAAYLKNAGDREHLIRTFRQLGIEGLEAAVLGMATNPAVAALIDLLRRTESRANAGDSAAASGGSAAAGTDPVSRLAGGRTPAPAQAPSLGRAVLAEAAAPKSPGAAGVSPSAARVPDKSEDNGTLQSKPQGGFQDDPRAKRDTGSPGRALS